MSAASGVSVLDIVVRSLVSLPPGPPGPHAPCSAALLALSAPRRWRSPRWSPWRPRRRPRRPRRASSDYYLCTGYVGCATPATTTTATASAANSDVLADVLRPQLHQLRRLPAHPGRHVERAAVVRHRHRDNWGRAMADITDKAPAVGAVAWWRATCPGLARPATSPSWRRSSRPRRSSSARTPGAGTSTGAASSPAAQLAHRVHPLRRRRQGRREHRPPDGARARPGRRGPGATTGALERHRRRRLQWLVDGVEVPGATSRRFTPRPRDGRRTRLGPGHRHPSQLRPGRPRRPRDAPGGPGRLAVATPTLDGTGAVGERPHRRAGHESAGPDSTPCRGTPTASRCPVPPTAPCGSPGRCAATRLRAVSSSGTAATYPAARRPRPPSRWQATQVELSTPPSSGLRNRRGDARASPPGDPAPSHVTDHLRLAA